MLINLNVDLSKLKKKYGILVENRDFIQLLIDEHIEKGITPYVPKDIGKLEESIRDERKLGELKWKTEYAKYVYHGKTASGKDMVYNRKKNPLAGPRWAERYKSDNIEDIKSMIVQVVNKI